MRVIRNLVFVVAFVVCTGAACASDAYSIKSLSKALTALASDVDPTEAELASETAHTTARSLKVKYHVVLNPEFQCFLINVGLRKRGWCGHWTRDIGERLKELKLKTLVLHWGAAYAGTTGEDNCLVVTARNQPFQDGIIIDGWRRAADYSGAQSEKTMSMNWNSITAIQGSRHGKRKWSTPPGCRTTDTPTNLNRRREKCSLDFVSHELTG